MALHVRFSIVGVEEERFSVCDFKSFFSKNLVLEIKARSIAGSHSLCGISVGRT